MQVKAVVGRADLEPVVLESNHRRLGRLRVASGGGLSLGLGLAGVQLVQPAADVVVARLLALERLQLAAQLDDLGLGVLRLALRGGRLRLGR